MGMRTLSLACSLALLVALTGCTLFESSPDSSLDDPATLSKPEHAVIVLMDGIKTADIEAVKSAVIYPDNLLTEDVEEVINNPLVQAGVKAISKKLAYVITSIEESSETASLTLDVTHPDLSPIITSNFNTFAPEIVSQLSLGTFDQASMQSKIIWAVAADLISGKATSTQTETIVVNCRLDNGQWKVLPDRPILNVCTGGALSALDELDYSLLSKS